MVRTRRRRDRHGRGLRGPLCPSNLPLARSRADRFDDLVLDAVELLERDWDEQLSHVELAVEDVPPVPLRPDPDWTMPLGRALSPARDRPARIVVYRRPVEARAADPDELADLVRAVVVEQLADLLGLTPEQVDPDYEDGLDD